MKKLVRQSTNHPIKRLNVLIKELDDKIYGMELYIQELREHEKGLIDSMIIANHLQMLEMLKLHKRGFMCKKMKFPTPFNIIS